VETVQKSRTDVVLL